MHLCPRLWKRLPQVENIPNISLDRAVQSPEITFITWKEVHQDWVSKVKNVLLLLSLLMYVFFFFNLCCSIAAMHMDIHYNQL